MTASPLVIAHRGASAYRPENTLPAYALAVEQGADMIEVDLHRTRDGAVVVAHDAELVGIGGQGEIADASLAAVRALDAGEGARVPTLEEMLDGFGDRIAFNLEIKRGSRGLYEGLEEVAWRAVSERGIQKQTLFSSFYDPVLETLRVCAPGARIALLVSRRIPDGALDRARRLGAEALNPDRSLVTPELVAGAHAAGLAVYPYTVNATAEMERLLGMGVDGIFTNHPDRMRALLVDPRGAPKDVG